MFVLISEKNSVAKEGHATRNWKMQLNLQKELKPQDNGFRNCFLTLQGISYSRCHYHYFTTFFGFSSSLKLFNYIFVCIWDRYSGSFPPIYFLLSFPQFLQSYIHLYNQEHLLSGFKKLCRRLAGERFVFPLLPCIPKCKDTSVVREMSLPTVKSPYGPSAEALKSINSVFQQERMNLAFCSLVLMKPVTILSYLMDGETSGLP